MLSIASQLQYLSRFEVQLAKREFLFKRFLDLHYKEIQVFILMNENNSWNYNVFHGVKQYGYSIQFDKTLL